MGRGEHKASERRIESAEKKRKALELKKMGYNYQEIADAVGYPNRSRAYEAVQRALEEIVREPAEEVLKIELERLDRLMRGIWEEARGGNLQAMDRVLKIMDRRAALLGIDLRTQMDVADREHLTKRIEALESEQRQSSGQTLPPRARPAGAD